MVYQLPEHGGVIDVAHYKSVVVVLPVRVKFIVYEPALHVRVKSETDAKSATFSLFLVRFTHELGTVKPESRGSSLIVLRRSPKLDLKAYRGRPILIHSVHEGVIVEYHSTLYQLLQVHELILSQGVFGQWVSTRWLYSDRRNYFLKCLFGVPG